MRRLDFSLSGFAEDRADDDLRQRKDSARRPVRPLRRSLGITGVSSNALIWTIIIAVIVSEMTPLRTIYNVKLKTGAGMRDAARAVQLARHGAVGKRTLFTRAVEIVEATRAARDQMGLTSSQSIWAAELAKKSNPNGEVVVKEVLALADSIKKALSADSPQAATVQSINFNALANHRAVVVVWPPTERVSIQCNVVGTDGYFVPHYGQTDAFGRVSFVLPCIRNDADRVWAAVVLNGSSVTASYK